MIIVSSFADGISHLHRAFSFSGLRLWRIHMDEELLYFHPYSLLISPHVIQADNKGQPSPRPWVLALM